MTTKITEETLDPLKVHLSSLLYSCSADGTPGDWMNNVKLFFRRESCYPAGLIQRKPDITL